MEITYCFKCGRRIIGTEFDKGSAFQVGSKVTCKACAPGLLETLEEKDRQQLQKLMLQKSQERSASSGDRGAASSAATPSVTASSMLKGTARYTPPAKARSSLPWIAAGSGAILLLVGIIALVPGRSSTLVAPADPQPPPAPAAPAPTDVRAQEIRDAVRRAKELSDREPENFAGQKRLWDRASQLAEGTPFAPDVRFEQERFRARRKEAIAKRAEALDRQTEPLLAKEAFKEALEILSAGRSSDPSPEWMVAVDHRIDAARSAASSLFASVREAAVEARRKNADAELRAAADRIRKWGLAEYVSALESALAAVPAAPGAAEAPPAPPKVPDPGPAPAAPPVAVAPKPARLPVPEAARQRELESALRKRFTVDQARTPKARAELARTILAAAAAPGTQGAELYVQLRQARVLAVQGGDVASAIEAIDRIASGFEVDKTGETLDLFAKATVKGADAAAWASAAYDLGEAAAEADNYEAAVRLIGSAESLGRSAGDKGMQERAKDRARELIERGRLWDEIRPQAKTLEAAPEDAAANAAVGKFMVLLKHDWIHGLPLLAKAADPALKSLAAQELAMPSDPPAQAALGEAWAALAERETVTYRARARARAAEWLIRAIPGLPGQAKVAAERRVAAFGPIAPSHDGASIDLGGGVRMEFIHVRPGSFVMGGPDSPEFSWQLDQRPEHRVTLTKGYYLGKYLVTRRQFAVFARESGYKTDAEKAGFCQSWDKGPIPVAGSNWQDPKVFTQTDDHPVCCMTWNDARAFCEWAAGKTGRGIRLPTEAEWEYACRAGTKTRFSFGDDERALGEYAWFIKNAGSQTHPVGQKKPNPWGFYDMYGNVWQWVQDQAGPYGGDVVDPVGPASGDQRIVRGASVWDLHTCSALRGSGGPSDLWWHRGFRVVMQ